MIAGKIYSYEENPEAEKVIRIKKYALIQAYRNLLLWKICFEIIILGVIFGIYPLHLLFQ
ncbi:Uncharacterised protein [Legionella sainthelensi]|nr:Uncharacterised protein [Legionella sainthelensi]